MLWTASLVHKSRKVGYLTEIPSLLSESSELKAGFLKQATNEATKSNVKLISKDIFVQIQLCAHVPVDKCVA